MLWIHLVATFVVGFCGVRGLVLAFFPAKYEQAIGYMAVTMLALIVVVINSRLPK